MYSLDLGEKRLTSVFQPIYSFSNQSCVGAEVLVRGTHTETAQPISVPECLQVPAHLTPIEFKSELNRLHCTNWMAKRNQHNWLFLNIDFQNFASQQDLCIGELIENLGLLGKELVIEIVENEIPDEELFAQLLNHLRELGCLIALDDFGAGHSNIDRIWTVQPDIVKLDRKVLLNASESYQGEGVLRNLCNLIKEAGCIVLLEGVETHEQALLAMEVGADLVQGFYFARPEKEFEYLPGEKVVQEVADRFQHYALTKRQQEKQLRRNYEFLFDGLTRVDTLLELQMLVQEQSERAPVKRWFILDEMGYQVSEDKATGTLSSTHKVSVLQRGKGLCWKNRNYFLNAMESPGKIIITKPYRSMIDVEMCFTTSKLLPIQTGQRYVVCYDLEYH